MPAGDLVLYAQWTINSYTVSFDSRDGAVPPVTQPYVSTFTLPSACGPATPSRAGTLLAGGAGTPYAAGAEPHRSRGRPDAVRAVGDQQLHGELRQPGRGPTPGARRRRTFVVAHAAVAPARTGYTFTGWNTAAGGSGIPYAAGGSSPFPHTTRRCTRSGFTTIPFSSASF